MSISAFFVSSEATISPFEPSRCALFSSRKELLIVASVFFAVAANASAILRHHRSDLGFGGHARLRFRVRQTPRFGGHRVTPLAFRAREIALG